MSIFLIFKVINSIRNIKFCYNKFILERVLYDFKFSKRKVSRDIYSFYMESNHYIDFMDEKSYLKEYFKY